MSKLKISEQDLLTIEKKLIKFRAKELKAFAIYSKNPMKIFLIDFFEGVLKGAGFVVGGTLVIAITVILLTKLFSEIPFLGTYFKAAGEILENRNTN
jgi:hypothetical protein